MHLMVWRDDVTLFRCSPRNRVSLVWGSTNWGQPRGPIFAGLEAVAHARSTLILPARSKYF